MGKVDSDTLRLVTGLVETLGVRPDDTDDDLLAADDILAELTLLVLREDMRKVAAFHRQTDWRLRERGVSFEEVVAHGMRERRVDFFEGVEAIAAERCYEAADGETGAHEGQVPSNGSCRSWEVPAETLRKIWRRAHSDYVDYFDDAALAQTRLEFDGRARRVRKIARFLGSMFGLGKARDGEDPGNEEPPPNGVNGPD